VKSAIFTAVSGAYIYYAPLFRFCSELSYPGVDVVIHTLDDSPTPFFAAVCRLLYEVDGYDEVYVTDADMIHLPTIDLFRYHRERMEATGLCYSNSPRGHEHRGAERLTGLHFCTKEWYKRTKKSRTALMEKALRGEIGGSRFDDELALMQVAVESGVGIPPRERLIGRHMGAHLGTIRCYLSHGIREVESQLRVRVTVEQAEAWNDIVDMPKFREMVRGVCEKSPMIAEQLEVLERFTRKWATKKTDRYYLKYR